MSAFDDIKAKLLIPGSSDYYAWRFTPSIHQSAWLALACLQQTLWDIVLHYREASIAQAKLIWWSEEIARTLAAQAEHPITQALLIALPDIAKAQGLLTEWIEGMMAAMICQHLCTDADFSLMAKRSTGMPALLLCQYHDLQNPHSINVISQQSDILLFDRYLHHRQRLLSQGQLWIPLHRLTQAALTPEHIGEFAHAKALQSMLRTWLETLYCPSAASVCAHEATRPPADDYLTSWKKLNPTQQAVLTYPHALTRIALKRCARFLKRDHITWTTAVPDLTPLGKLWLAYH